MSDTDELTDTVITVKETKSAVAATTPSRGSPNVSVSAFKQAIGQESLIAVWPFTGFTYAAIYEI